MGQDIFSSWSLREKWAPYTRPSISPACRKLVLLSHSQKTSFCGGRRSSSPSSSPFFLCAPPPLRRRAQKYTSPSLCYARTAASAGGGVLSGHIKRCVSSHDVFMPTSWEEGRRRQQPQSCYAGQWSRQMYGMRGRRLDSSLFFFTVVSTALSNKR